MDRSQPHSPSELIKSDMEDFDPSTEGGFRVVHDLEVPIEVRLTELHDMPQDIGSLEAIRVKVMVKGDHFNTEAVKVCHENLDE